MNLFMDTEFTDLLEPILISIGMVTDTGEEFYAEVPYPDDKCTPFVREAVLPQLGRNPDFYCCVSDLGTKLRQWLQLVRREDETVYLCFDYSTDWDLFLDSIQFRIAPWMQGKLINTDIDEIALYEFYKETGLSRHHALHDALANKFAYRPIIANEKIEQRRILKIRGNWRKKLPKQFTKSSLRAIRESKSEMARPNVLGDAGNKRMLKGSFRRARQPGSLQGAISIAASFDAPRTFSADSQNVLDANDDSDWVRNPITQELLDTLNGRTPSPLAAQKDTVIKLDATEDPMINSEHFDDGTPLVLTQRESLMILDWMENPPPRNASFIRAMAEYQKSKDVEWQQTKPIICRSRFIDPKDGSDELIVPAPEKLLQELGWTIGDILDIKINENKELVYRKR